MGRLLAIGAAVCAAVAVTGCVSTVEGSAVAGTELSRPTPLVPVTGATPVAPAPPPQTAAAPNVEEPALDGLLVPLDDVRNLLDAPELAVEQSYTAMPPSTVGYDPPTCVSAAYNVVEAAYRDSGFVAVRGVALQEPAGVQVTHNVDQGVVTFPDAAAAAGFVARSVDGWRQCATLPFTATRPEVVERWTFGDVGEGGGIFTVSKSVEGGEGWRCGRAMTSKANVVVDVSACGFGITDQAAAIATRIRDKIPG
ncbi:sensor domain-containing protein [Mycobacterium sp. MYCO198283]|uniref:sensor domain-containing protein n=1 Tax=Mycobacterium sp. MYCO198283 TaxID=2883505 RepID=UPI001E285307|nr:sensor domain-containing protein [Mycobacterium sp. MYCO198283]MCG5432380.1 sensor domain-containing protein [Mycobacterium sp. MYCO198283]